jgi:hypothetical protein
LRERAPSAERIGAYTLQQHDLRFHKSGRDGSGKCDAYFTNNQYDYVIGALFEIDQSDKSALDIAEGLGHGYAQKNIAVLSHSGDVVVATTYCAIRIDVTLQPYSWYLHHVLVGARESGLLREYIEKLESTNSIQDRDKRRDSKERAVHF